MRARGGLAVGSVHAWGLLWLLALGSFVGPGRAAGDLLVAGLVVNGKEIPAGTEIRVWGEAHWVPLAPLADALGLAVTEDPDGAVRLDTPLGEARIPAEALRAWEGTRYARADVLAERLASEIRFDEQAYALVVRTPWRERAGPPPGVEVVRPDADMARAARFNLSRWRTEANGFFDPRNERQLAYTDTEVGGALGTGLWRLRHLYNSDPTRNTLREYQWIDGRDRYRWLLGHQDVGVDPLLGALPLTGGQIAYTNRPELLYRYQGRLDRLIGARAQAIRDLEGEGPAGGIAELRIDDRVVRRRLIALDGRYRFRDVRVPQSGAQRVVVYLYRSLSGELVGTEDFTRSVGDYALPAGVYSLYAGAGLFGNPLENLEAAPRGGGAAAFAQWRQGLSDWLTLDASAQYDGLFGAQFAAGSTWSLGRWGWLGLRGAWRNGRLGASFNGDGDLGRWFWRGYATYKQQGFDLSMEATEDAYAEVGMRGSRWGISAIGRHRRGAAGRAVDFLLPAGYWNLTDSLRLGARPDAEGVYEYRLDWRLAPRATLRAYYRDRLWRGDLNWYPRPDWTVRAAAYQAGREEPVGGSLRLRVDRPAWWRLYAEAGGSVTGEHIGFRGELGFEPYPGLRIRGIVDDDFERSQDQTGLIVQLNLVADFSITPSGLAPGSSRFDAFSHGAVAGRIVSAGADLSDLDLSGVQILLAGQPRGETERNGSFVLRRLRPGVYPVALDPERLPIELSPLGGARWVEVRAGVTTHVDFAVERRFGFAGRVSDAAGRPVAEARIRVHAQSDGRRVADTRTNRFGIYRVGDLRPGRYRVEVVDEDGARRAERTVEIRDRFLFGQDLSTGP